MTKEKLNTERSNGQWNYYANKKDYLYNVGMQIKIVSPSIVPCIPASESRALSFTDTSWYLLSSSRMFEVGVKRIDQSIFAYRRVRVIILFWPFVTPNVQSYIGVVHRSDTRTSSKAKYIIYLTCLLIFVMKQKNYQVLIYRWEWSIDFSMFFRSETDKLQSTHTL